MIRTPMFDFIDPDENLYSYFLQMFINVCKEWSDQSLLDNLYTVVKYPIQDKVEYNENNGLYLQQMLTSVSQIQLPYWRDKLSTVAGIEWYLAAVGANVRAIYMTQQVVDASTGNLTTRRVQLDYQGLSEFIVSDYLQLNQVSQNMDVLEIEVNNYSTDDLEEALINDCFPIEYTFAITELPEVEGDTGVVFESAHGHMLWEWQAMGSETYQSGVVQ